MVEECLRFDEDFFFNSDIGKILCENSFFFESRLNYSRLVTERRGVIIPYNEREHLINICRILIGDYIIVEATEEICELYKIAHMYVIPRVVEFCRRMLKQHVYVDNLYLIDDIADTYKDSELETISSTFKKESKKFICWSLRPDHLKKPLSEGDNIYAPYLDNKDHLHDVFFKYLKCKNPFEFKQKYCDKEIEFKLILSSFFDTNENGEITLSLESDFGKLLCKESDNLKHTLRLQDSSSKTEKQVIQVLKENIEPFKNIYRLLMGANHIKASRSSDIIRMYQLSASYGISPIMETCRSLFKKHICSRNVEPIGKLAEKYSDDFELQKIVESFQTEFEKYGLMHIERKFKSGRYFESNNFEIPTEECSYYK